MSEQSIRQALEVRLAALSSPLSTAYENDSFTPVSGTPYQRVNMLRATPEDLVMGRTLTQYSGILQVSLFYPLGTGSAAAEAKAELIKAHFLPPMTLTEDSINIHINDTPRIGTGFRDEDRWVIPISIPWISYITN